jgi:hypothetical protein
MIQTEINSRGDNDLGRNTAIFEASCIIHTDQRIPEVIHWKILQDLSYFLFGVLLNNFDIKRNTTKPSAKDKKYPLTLLNNTFPITPLVPKELSNRKVVETGILNFVKINKITGANICKKLNDVGVSAKPLDSSLWCEISPLYINQLYPTVAIKIIETKNHK